MMLAQVFKSHGGIEMDFIAEFKEQAQTIGHCVLYLIIRRIDYASLSVGGQK
jgi:hypothetical protein